jgi:pimeloyl-ACP methyl ester carboxylesterase
MIPYREDYFPSHFVELNGALLHYKRAGKGPPVLLLHGYPETWYTWRHTIAALMPYFTVFAPDLRGWGQSVGPGPYGLRTLVEDTVAMLRFWEKKFPTMHVVGHDWGAAVTFALRKVAPERLGKLVTIGMPVKRFDMTKTLHFYAFNTPLLPELVMHYQSDWVVERILRWWAHNHEAFPPDVVQAYQAAARQPGANAATRGYYRNTFRTALLRRAESYGIGMQQPPNTQFDWLCLWGGDDPVSPLKNVAYFKEDQPGVPVEIIPQAGHFPQEEQPGVFNRLLLDFLQR